MRRVAITGGSGFLGTALTKRLLTMPQIERVRVVSRDEHKKARMVERFGRYSAFQALLGDVRERNRLEQIFSDIDVVIHAAALKRVDNDSDEAIEMKKTNIDGTQNVLEAATACGVQRVMFVSSDKACAAENAYGKSKAMAEEIAVAYNSIAYPRNTRISCVRYGNVLWSTGSVLCKWTEAKAARRPFNITDLHMTRFLLTVDQAVDFILLALNSMMGGEIFIPKLLSAKIGDLASALDPEWPTQLVGLRPGGEKKAERLIGVEEMTRTVEQPGSFVVIPSRRGWSAVPYHGKPIDPTWIYASDTVPLYTVDEIREML